MGPIRADVQSVDEVRQSLAALNQILGKITTGTATLDGASPAKVTVSTSKITTSSRVYLSRKTAGGTLGHLSVGTVVAGTSFQILSSANGETSTVNWLIIEP